MMDVETLTGELRAELEGAAKERGGMCVVALRGSDVRHGFGASSAVTREALTELGFWYCEASKRWFTVAGIPFFEMAGDDAPRV